jgi:hypothetical protein
VPDEYHTTWSDAKKPGGFDIAVALLAPKARKTIQHLADPSLTAVTSGTLPEGPPLIIAGYPGDKPSGTLWKCLILAVAYAIR